MTLIEYEYFRKIETKECLNQSWNGKNKKDRAPNIVALIDRFNKLSRWVIMSIVKEEELERRAQLIQKFTSTAIECRKISNFNSMMGIACGLMSSPIIRLKKSWKVTSLFLFFSL